MENEIIHYVIEARDYGLSDTEIKQNLLDAGWEAEKIEESFAHARAEEQRPAANNDEDIAIEPIEHVMRPLFVEKPASEKPKTEQSLSGQKSNIPSLLAQKLSGKKPLLPEKPTDIKPDLQNISQMPVLETHTVIKVKPSDPAMNVTESHFKDSSLKSHTLRNAILGIVIFLAVSAGGYFAYANFFASPQKIWQKFTQNEADKIFQNKFTFSYADNYSSGEAEDSTINLKNISLSLSGKSYTDTADSQNPIESSDIQYTFGSGNTSFSTGLKLMVLDKALYLNVGDNPLINSLVNANTGGQKAGWIKIDYNVLKENSGSESGIAQMEQFFSGDLQKEISKIWEDAELIKMEKYLGKEKIDGVSTLHFKNSVDKQAIKNAVNATFDRITNAMNQNNELDTVESMSQGKIVLDAIVDRLEVKNLETWIGAGDFRLYKIKFSSNAPSVISLIKNASSSFGALGVSLAKSRDAVRIADMRQQMTALELYFNDNNGYPPSSEGKPVNLNPYFVGDFAAPLPADGNCTEYFNTFWYEPKGKNIGTKDKPAYESYEYSFCLGETTGGYAAGIGKATPSGIEGGIPCVGTNEQCVSNRTPANVKSDEELIRDFVSNWDFGAELNIETTYSDYGKKQEFTAPENAYDIFSSLKTRGGDSARISNIRQIASALELYYNDYTQYPDSLSQLETKYISQLPVAPPLNSNICTEGDNNYTYTKSEPEKYSLTFCLETASSGYIAGKHTLSPSGIQ